MRVTSYGRWVQPRAMLQGSTPIPPLQGREWLDSLALWPPPSVLSTPGVKVQTLVGYW